MTVTTPTALTQPSPVPGDRVITRGRVRSALLVALLLAASFVPVWGAAHNLSYRNDDTYITLTYAKSLAAGQGWRFNGGPQALGTTTPLFALAVAGLAMALPGVPMEQLAVGVSVAGWLGTGWTFWLGRRAFRLTPAAAALAALAVFLQGGWLFLSLGMEATTLVFGLVVATWLAARGNALACGLVAASLFLVRPEGLAMVPLAGAWLVWQRRPRWRATLGRFALGAALPLLAWAGYAQATFGSVLPNSVVAKVGQGAGWPGQPFMERLLAEWLPSYLALFGTSPTLSLLPPLVALGLVWAARRARPMLLLAAWLVVFLVGYALLRAPGYWWYMMPVLFGLHAFAALGLAALLASRWRVARALGGALAVVFLVLASYHSVTAAARGFRDPRAPTYLSVAAWLRDNAAPRSSVAFVEVGYLGYFSSNRVVDLAGLVNPEFTDRATELDLASNFWQAQPDYFLHHPRFDWLLGPIVGEPRFAEQYRPAAEFPSPHLGSPMVLYERVED